MEFRARSSVGRTLLRFNPYVTDAADNVVAGFIAFFDGEDFHGVGVVMRTQHEVAVGKFHVLDGAGFVFVFADGVHILFALAIGSQGVVVAVEEKGCAGEHAGKHAHAFAGVNFDNDKTLPCIAVAFDVFAEATEESFFEFQDFFHVHVHDERFLSGHLGVGDDDALEFVGAGGEDRRALVDFGGVEQVEHGDVLHGENLVHAFEAQSALAIEEVRDMGLLEAGLRGQVQAGKIAFVNALPKSFAEVVL